MAVGCVTTLDSWFATLPPDEKLGALDSILQKLEKKSEPLRFKLQALRMSPEIRRPQDAAVQNMLAQVEEEVRILQADERTKMNQQGITETVFRAVAKQASKPAKKPCQFFSQGHCRKGDQCAYAHLSPCIFVCPGSLQARRHLQIPTRDAKQEHRWSSETSAKGSTKGKGSSKALVQES